MDKCSRYRKILPVVIAFVAFIVLAFGNNFGNNEGGCDIPCSLEMADVALTEGAELREVAYRPRPRTRTRSNHVSAVGIVEIRTHQRLADRGTATLVEPNIAISAAHVFKNVLPRADVNKVAGPVHVDLRNQLVYWYYQPNDGSAKKKVRVLSMVVDARFLHAQDMCREDRLSLEAQKHDMVFLELDPSTMPKEANHVPLVTNSCKVGQMCASYGYGVSNRFDRPVRKSIVYHLTLPQASRIHDVIMLGNQDNQPRGDYRRAVQEVSMLTGQSNLAPHEAYVGQAQPGDSGGPLFAVTSKGIRVIGVMSLYGARPVGHAVYYYNGFCSLISGDLQTGHYLSPRAKELLDHIKRNRTCGNR